MTGFMQTQNSKINQILNNKNENSERKEIFNDLMSVVKDCQIRYGSKRELATETDSRIIKLCDCWEAAVSHGLRSNNNSVLKNVADLVSGGTLSEPPSFWDFAFQHLTQHEKERFTNLRHVWTDRGKCRSLIRAALNERALERYVLIWLSDQNLGNNYENWALMRDPEITHLLPTMAAGLSAILFAITIDSPDLNVPPRVNELWPEPVIAAPIPVKTTRKSTIVKRKIMSFDEQSLSSSAPSFDSTISISKPSSSNFLRKSIEELQKDINANEELNQEIPSTIIARPETPGSIHMFSFDNDLTQISSNSDNLPITSSDSIEIEEILESSGNSSIKSKTSSDCSSDTEIQALKEKLSDVQERCSMLESRIAELSLENQRLRNLSSSKNTQNYFAVSIPRVFLQKHNSKNFYSYEIVILPVNGGDEWKISKRYSDFYRLHKKYQKDNVAIKALDFPPKRKFGNMDAHFVEERRQRLQVYLKHLIAILTDVAACTTRSQLEETFPFFKTY